MADRFDLFRLSLLPRREPSLFGDRRLTREQYLRSVFASDWEFSHYGHRVYYTPDLEHSSGDVLFGLIGRNVLIEENLPPDQGLRDSTHPGWRACVLCIDPREHPDGQKAAIELNREIGGPVALMGRFAKEINERNTDAPFQMEAQPLFDAQTFWEFAEENRGEITSLTFDLVVPNGLWSTRSSVKTELQRLRDATRVEEVKTRFHSEQGIETNAEQIKQVVRYAEGGSGKVSAKTRRGKRFSSTEKPKVAILDVSHPPQEPLIVRAARNIAKIFGRE